MTPSTDVLQRSVQRSASSTVYAATSGDIVVEMSRRGRLRIPMRPTIQAIEGRLVVEPEPQQTWVQIDFDAGSFTTGWARADRALRGPQVLDVASYGVIRFESAGWQRWGDRYFSVSGDLYVRDSSVPIVVEARMVSEDEDTVRFAARSSLHRRSERVTVLAGVRFTRIGDEAA